MKDNTAEKIRKEAEAINISKSPSDILLAYHLRQNEKKEKDVIKTPLYRRNWFRPVAISSSACLIIGTCLGFIIPLLNNSQTPIYQTPALSTVSDKLIFEINNVAGLITNSVSYKTEDEIKNENYVKFKDKDESADEAELKDIAYTYHRLFTLLDNSSSTDGKFVKNENHGKGKKYRYKSPSLNYVIDMDADPDTISDSFTADLLISDLVYSIQGNVTDSLVSIDVSNNNILVGSIKEEINSLKPYRSRFTFQQIKDTQEEVIFFDGDFSSSENKDDDVEINISRYTDGLLTSSFEYESYFEKNKTEIEFSYKKDGKDIDGKMNKTVSNSRSTYTFAYYPYKFSFDN